MAFMAAAMPSGGGFGKRFGHRDTAVPVELHSYHGVNRAFKMMAEAAISQAITRDIMSRIGRLVGLSRLAT